MESFSLMLPHYHWLLKLHARLHASGGGGVVMINTVFAQLSQQGHLQPSEGSGEKQPYAFTFKHSIGMTQPRAVAKWLVWTQLALVHHNALWEVCSILFDEFTGVCWNTKSSKNSSFSDYGHM